MEGDYPTVAYIDIIPVFHTVKHIQEKVFHLGPKLCAAFYK